MNNLDVLPLSAEKRAQGYGKFPYVIVRLQGGVYMQYPIHFYEDGKLEKPGLRILVDSVQNEEHNFNLLFEIVRDFHNKINPEKDHVSKICLVLSPTKAYFYEENEFNFSNEIPEGGALFDTQYKMMAMNSPHYVID